MAEPTTRVPVDFHLDPMCPWAYQTAVWIRRVREQRPLEITWRFFSLEEVNREEGKKHPWEREWSYGWSLMRIGALLRRQDMDLLDRWYLTAGTALHVEGRKPHRREVAEELLAGMGLDPQLVGEVLDTLRLLAHEGMTMICVTHEMRFAREVSDRVAFFKEGLIHEIGPPAQIFDAPQRPETATFLSATR